MISAREEPSLEAFLPRRGDGRLSLSASDLTLYLTCPLKYKFARVFGIPQEPTINQRFGILMHNVLERFHKEPPEPGDGAADAEPALRGAAGGASGFGATDDELQYRDRGREALRLYWERERDLRVRAGLAGAQVRLQGRRPPRARPGRPGRPAARRRLRADRLQDRRTEDRGGPRLRPAAGALPDGGARGLGHRGRLRLLRLRARRRQGGGADQARRRRAGRAHRASRSARASSPRTSSRAPHRASAAGATTA